jgi:glucose-6-phosphate isomerase
MNAQWDFASFNLDLSHLWDIPNGISCPKDFQTQMKAAWLAFISKCQSQEIGFFDWPRNIPKSELAQISGLTKKLTTDFEGAICIGIGGSYLGPAAIQEALRPVQNEKGFSVIWVSNADSGTLLKAKSFLKNRKSATVIISKSGVTTETLSAFFHLSRELSSEGFVVITDPQKGELRRLSNEMGWHSLPVPPNIGGRFSVLTSVGLLPLALQGVSVEELLRGADSMRSKLTQFSPEENPAVWYAFSKFLWDGLGRSVQYLMPYDSRLKLIGDWYVQLWAESLGKKQLGTNRAVGPNPVAALGTSDQHSLLQLFKEGPSNRLIGFIDLTEKEGLVVGKPSFSSDNFSYLTNHSFSELNVLASYSTEESLHNASVPTYRISLKELSAFSLGELLFFQETACAVAGEFYKVNAFDQPGVEETKRLLRSKL